MPLGIIPVSVLELLHVPCISPGKHLTREAPHLGSFSVLPLLANSFLTPLITADARELPRGWGASPTPSTLVLATSGVAGLLFSDPCRVSCLAPSTALAHGEEIDAERTGIFTGDTLRL